MTQKKSHVALSFFRQILQKGICRHIFILSSVLIAVSLNGQQSEMTGEVSEQIEDTIQLHITPNEGFFAVEEPLLITLAFDMRGFQRSKDNPEDFPATITIRISDSDSITQDISLKARGESRRRICDLPPIMLNFKDMGEQVPGLEDPGKLKLVTYCKQSSLFENYVLKEYLVYKMYNLFTPYSYRARLVRVNYVDIKRPDKPYTAYGFIIEDLDDVAERNNSVELDNPNLSVLDMIPDEMLQLSLFQYMIGNTDWAVASLHNIKLVKSLELLTDKAIPIPYDFDFSGFVYTNYAAPAPALRQTIKEVTERYFVGACPEEEALNEAVDKFEALEEPLMETITNFPYFSSSSYKQTQKYIAGFYNQCEKRNVLMNNILRSCRHFD